MECLYHPGLNNKSKKIEILDDEFKHLKALRLKVNEKIYVTNGRGLTVSTELIDLKNKKATLIVENQYKDKGELDYRLGLAIGLLSDRNRLEFSLEKAVELGCTDFYPLISKYCEKTTINLQRLNRKAIAAMKQSLRSKLTIIHNQLELQQLNEISKQFKQIILADENTGKIIEKLKKVDTLIVIGPEGGFDEEEMNYIVKELKAKKVKLADRRLRAETAAITSLSLITNILS